MKTNKALLGARIKELRKAKGLSQDQLSETIGIDPKHLSRIEVGKSYPYMETLESIAKSLDVEIKDLFEFKHLEKEVVTIEGIGRMLDGASEDKLRLVVKFIRTFI
ncbi:XRE family transcriptional regulator [bacterium]|nr:XRE family transcriptional regulator [bacterium]